MHYGAPPPGYVQAQAHARVRGPAIDLVAVCTSNAWKFLGFAIGALLLGVVVSMLGLATGFLVIPGVILFIVGLVAIPLAIVRLFDPTKAGTVRDLAATANERRQWLASVAAEILHPSTWCIRASKGAFYGTPSFFVFHGSSSLEIIRIQDLLHVWQKVARSGRIFTKETHTICFRTRSGSKGELPVLAVDVQVFPTLARAYPWAFFGHDRALESMPIQRLAWEVDARRASMMTLAKPARPT